MTDFPDEKQKSFEVAAVFVNRFFIARSMVGTRISFGEGQDQDLQYRSAVMMLDADAIALRDTLIQLFPVPEKQN